MPRTKHQPSSRLSRLAAVTGLAVTTAALGLDRPGRAAAEEATPDAMANHPIVGAWLVTNPTTPPRASGTSFTADGIMTISDAPSYVDPAFGVAFAGASIGTWEPTGARSFRFTLVQPLSDAAGAYLGTFALDGFPEVSEDGLSFVDEGTVAKMTIRDANNVVVMQAGGGGGEEPMTPPVHARRIRVGDPGFPEGTPGTATPTP